MTDALGRWAVEFYDFTSVLPQVDVDELAGFGAVHERAARNGARHGTPIVLEPSGHADPRINLFFRTGTMAGRSPSTWRRYAYALVVWLEFLRVFGRSWDEATPRDVEAFKDWRLTDLRNGERVQPTSFDTDRAALNAFYGWAAARYAVAVPPHPTGTGAAGVVAGARRVAEEGARLGGHLPSGQPTDLGSLDRVGRPGRRVSLWARPHMCRHSFALKWFSILSVVWKHRVDGFDGEEMKDLREQFGDIWYQLAALLGHRDPMIAKDIYLEPFSALEIDYLMSLLDEDETTAVDALMRTLAAGSGRTLISVTSPASSTGAIEGGQVR